MPDPSPNQGYGALVALTLVILVSVGISIVAQRIVQRGSFLTGYFLGNRGLGAWALALTATVQSGGTFMGYPSLIYTHGWVVGLWIASYMVVPITGFAILGKRFAQLSHRTGAITVPDLFRARFASRWLGLVTALLILVFLTFMMIAQFKAGAILMKLAWPHSGTLAITEDLTGGVDTAYLIGLAIFACTVVGYTLIGGFLASVWTDLFQSLLMVVGIAILFVLVVPGISREGWQQATVMAVDVTSPKFAWPPGYSTDGRAFLPLSLAFSYFVVWIFGGIGSPAGMVRVMASKDSRTMRRSIALLSIYNLLIYLPLLVIFVGARAMFPNLDKPDEVLPRLALYVTQDLPLGSFLGGLILVAPFGAVMSTVSSYLVVIASGVVRDVYQHFFRPHASQVEMRRVSHVVMLTIGVIAVAANIQPVQYLQALVVFSVAACGATFTVPALMLAYWRRATAAGTVAAMAAGALTILALFLLGIILAQHGIDQMIDQKTAFRSYYPAGFHPIVFGLLASLVAGVVVSLITTPPPADVVDKLFTATPRASQ